MDCELCGFHKRRCICQPFWAGFDKMLETYNETKDKGPHILHPMRISTMSVNVRLPFTGINFDLIREQYERTWFSYALSSKNKRVKKECINMGFGKQKTNQNYNLKNNTLFMTSWMGSKQNLTRVSCQFFHNGSMTLTGLKSIDQTIKYLHKLMDYLKSFKEDPCYYRSIREYTMPDRLLIVPKKGKHYKETIIIRPQRVRFDYEMDNGVAKTYGIEVVTDEGKKWFYDIKRYEIEGGVQKMGRLNRSQLHFMDARVSMLNMNFRMDVVISQLAISKTLSEMIYSIWDETKTNLRPQDHRGPVSIVEFRRDSRKRSIKIIFVPNYKEIVLGNEINTRGKLPRFPREITIIMHRSGSVMFNGAKNMDDIFAAYNFILCMVRDNPEIIKGPGILDKKIIKKSYDYRDLEFFAIAEDLYETQKHKFDTIDEYIEYAESSFQERSPEFVLKKSTKKELLAALEKYVAK